MLRSICLLILHLFAFSLYAADTTYSRQWRDIDTTVFNRSLTRTALTKVHSLYQRSKKDNNQPQIIKTLLYRMYLEQGIKENSMEADVMLLKKELKETKDVAARSILLNIIARKYQQYYDYNQYRIYNRTNTGTFKEEDMATWTVEHLHKTITDYYLQSIEPKQYLQQHPFAPYETG